MSFKERIGIDLGRSIALEDGITWAAKNGVYYFDAQTDIAPNAMESFDDRRCANIAETCSLHRLHLGLHTLSAVNVAEISPFLRDAADQYLRAYIDLAARLKAEWVIVHGGYHFNGEPERAEVHYMPDTLADTVYFFERIPSPHLRWAFTINHAHYDPAGIKGFVDGMDMSRCEEVRIADNNGLYELHMHPGTGTVDFADMFRRIEATGFKGHYICAWGTIDQMLAGRDYLVELAAKAGVD